MQDLPLPQPMAPYLVTISLDANGPSWHQRGPMLPEADTLATTKRSIDMPLECGQDSGAAARSIDPRPGRLPACKSSDTGARTNRQLACPLNSSNLVDRFHTFVSAFFGPATKHLGGYLAWFDARLRASGDRCTRQVWRATLKVLSTRSPKRLWDMLHVGGPTQRQRSAAA